MFENLCTLPLTADLFAQALHPTEALLAVGLSSGHVQTFRLPVEAEAEDEDDDVDEGASLKSSGTATIDTAWRTRRHKGSCRTVGWSADGEILYTSGTDSLLKSASAHTGQVTSKILLPASRGGTLDPPTLLHALSPQTLLVATDSSALYLYDLRLPSSLSSHVTTKPSQEHHPHDDYISSLTPLPPSTESTSGESKQWVTTGGTTLAVTDLRRGVLVKSEDQEEELLSSVWVDGLRRSKGKAIVGNGNGVLTLWEKGVWDDQEERILVDREGQESLDCIVLRKDGGVGKELAVGVGDGTVRLVRLGVNRVVETLRHDDVEGVLGVGFDVHGRLISGGGSIVKVWSEAPGSGAHEDDDDSDANDSEDKGEKRLAGSDASEEESDSEEEKQKRKKKKKRAKKGKDIGNGILKFRGLE